MHDFSLPSRCLLKQSSAYELVYRQGRRHRGDGFILICRPNTLELRRLGISIHRKLRGGVRRNRIKRIIRETFRLYREVFPANCDVVLAVRPEFVLGSPRVIREAVIRVLAGGKSRPTPAAAAFVPVEN